MKTIYLTGLFCVIWCTALFSQDVTFTASLSSNQVAAGQQFYITFTANSSIDRFAPPELSQFRVLSGPNQSSSVTSINGRMTSSMTLSYDLVAPKEGVYIIGPATIVVKGKQIRSNALRLVVGKGTPGQQNNSAPATVTNQPDERSLDISKRLFIRAVPSKTSVYQGEEIIVSYKLYTNIDILDNQVDKLPDFNGFWSQEIKLNENVQWTIETYKGIRYQTAVLKQIILFPEHAGDLKLDPLGMTFLVRAPSASNDPFDQIFGSYDDVKRKIKSADITIHVKPLPDKGKPANFNGAVGTFALSASLDKKELKANETATYSLNISGSGNLKLMSAPVIETPEFFEKFDPKLEDQITVNANGVSGSRAYNYLLIPRKEGKFNLKPYHFTYFNPSSGRYVTLVSGPFPIQVNKAAPGSDPGQYATTNQQDIKSLGKDIVYIKIDPPSFSTKGSFHGSIAYYLLLSIGPLLFIGSVTYKKWNDKNNSDVVQVNKNKANKLAAKHLKSAMEQLKTGNKNAFFEEIYKGIYGYLSNKLNIPAASLNQETIVNKLRDASLSEAIIVNLVNILEDCEMARYAPSASKDPSVVYENAKNSINDIENNI